MKTSDLISDLRVALGEAKAQGNATVQISNIETYLAEMERINNADITLAEQGIQREAAHSKFEYDMEVWKVTAPLTSASQLKMFESVIEAGQTAIKSATIINGGAAVSLLAFLGNLLTKEAPHGVVFPIKDLSYVMLVFFLGVGFAGAGTAARYFSQDSFGAKKAGRAHFCKWVAIILVLLSFFAFFYGGVKAYFAIMQYPY